MQTRTVELTEKECELIKALLLQERTTLQKLADVRVDDTVFDSVVRFIFKDAVSIIDGLVSKLKSPIEKTD